jgi:hypothetical protein
MRVCLGILTAGVDDIDHANVRGFDPIDQNVVGMDDHLSRSLAPTGTVQIGLQTQRLGR